MTVPRRLRSRQGFRVHEAALPSDEITVLDGIPVTTVPRTLFDLAATKTRRDLERAVHEADVLRLHDPLSLSDLLARYPGHRGTRTIKQIVRARQSDRNVSREEFVDRFLALVDEYGLVRPELNLWIDGHEVDAAWREQTKAIAADIAALLYSA